MDIKFTQDGEPVKQLNGSYRVTFSATRGNVRVSKEAVFENLASLPRYLDVVQTNKRSFRTMLEEDLKKREEFLRQHPEVSA